MNMSLERRAFLKTLAGFGCVAAIDPEELLWTPGKKLISIPAVRIPLYWTVDVHIPSDNWYQDVVRVKSTFPAPDWKGLRPGTAVILNTDGTLHPLRSTMRERVIGVAITAAKPVYADDYI